MLHLGSSAALPYGDAVFDRVLALNTIYFWPDPRVDLKEIRRVLRSSGRAVLGAVAPWSTEGRDVFRHGFGLYDERQLSAMLMEAGFDTVSVDMITETVQMASGPWTRDYFIICAE
jgi:SAM-dependent methyltransferase